MRGAVPAAGGVSREDVEYALDATLWAACLQVSAERGLVSLDESLAGHFAHLGAHYPVVYAALRLYLSYSTGDVLLPPCGKRGDQ